MTLVIMALAFTSGKLMGIWRLGYFADWELYITVLALNEWILSPKTSLFIQQIMLRFQIEKRLTSGISR